MGKFQLLFQFLSIHHLQFRFLLPVAIFSTSGRHLMRYTYYGKFEVICSGFTFTKFPFDKQMCDMYFYSADTLNNFNISTHRIRFVKHFASESDIWQFEEFSLETGQSLDLVYKVWEIKIIVTFYRKYQYYIGNVLLPSFSLYLIQLAALLLPPETADRPMFSITVVLAYTFVLTSVFALIPRTNETVYLVVLLEIKLFLSVFTTCYMLFTCFFINNKSERDLEKSKKMIRRLDLLFAISSFVVVIATDSIILVLVNQ